jgi:hypothetical protein
LNSLLFDTPDGRSRPVVQQIFRQARPKACSDPKDKVLALFAVLKELKIPFPLPDYQKSVECIYTEATVACINYDQSLQPLLDAPNNTRNPSLPSWVPDWNVPWFEGMDPRSPDLVYADFCASQSAAPTWKFSSDNRELSLQGSVIDVVEYLSEPMGIHPSLERHLTLQRSGNVFDKNEVSPGLKSTSKILKRWLQLSARKEEYPTGETLGEAFYKTIIRYQSAEDIERRGKQLNNCIAEIIAADAEGPPAVGIRAAVSCAFDLTAVIIIYICICALVGRLFSARKMATLELHPSTAFKRVIALL